MKKWILIVVIVIIYGGLAYGAFRHYSHAKAVTPTSAEVQKAHDDALRKQVQAADKKQYDSLATSYNKLHGECLKGASTTALYNAILTVKVKQPVPACGTELLQ